MNQLSGRNPAGGLRGAAWCVALLLCALVAACDSGPGQDAAVIDFSRTAPTAKPAPGPPGRPVLRAAVGAMLSPQETYSLYREFWAYVAGRLDMDLEFVQRKTYGEINRLFATGSLDVAFICSGPYAGGSRQFGFDLLAMPEVRGSATYRAYLVVAAASGIERLEDLRAKTFAFTDPESNTGHLVPLAWLLELGETPDAFFSRTIYTYSHDRAVEAVARGLVDGAAVDSLIWDFMQEASPDLAARTRIIRRSEPFGIPPIVAAASLDPKLRERLRALLLDMHRDASGQAILRGLHIDRFLPPQPGLYDSIRALQERLAKAGGAS